MFRLISVLRIVEHMSKNDDSAASEFLIEEMH